MSVPVDNHDENQDEMARPGEHYARGPENCLHDRVGDEVVQVPASPAGLTRSWISLESPIQAAECELANTKEFVRRSPEVPVSGMKVMPLVKHNADHAVAPADN